MAINCCVLGNGILVLSGVTAMKTRVAAVTVKLVVPLIKPDVAVMTTGPPISTAVAKP